MHVLRASGTAQLECKDLKSKQAIFCAIVLASSKLKVSKLVGGNVFCVSEIEVANLEPTRPTSMCNLLVAVNN